MTGPSTDVANWSEAAEQWIAWARTENHDAFWAYRSAFAEFVGPGTGEAVEIGGGEGRISRLLTNLGWRTTLVEPVEPLMSAAKEAQSAHSYVSAAADAVPLDSDRFDLVMLYNVLMDVDDLTGSVVEAARLLAPTGRMIVGIVHPIQDVLSAVNKGRVVTPYFAAQHFDETFTRNGLEMRFRGWMRPLSDYVNTLAEAGLAISRMAEPEPDPQHPVTQRLTNGRVRPVFLWLDLCKAQSGKRASMHDEQES
ncbi:MAG: class I SAM-dependent methyltransferase [Pseudomonadota bacterium]